MNPAVSNALARLRAVDWRGIRAHLDWRLLTQRPAWLWSGGSLVVLLSLLGSWTLPWNSTVQVGDYYTSDYVYTYYNSDTGENAFHTLAFLLVIPAVAAGLAWAALTPWPEAPRWLRRVPWAVLGVVGLTFAVYTVKALLDANELINDYYATNTSFPGGVGFCLLGLLVMAWGARRLNRVKVLAATSAVPPPVGGPSPAAPSA